MSDKAKREAKLFEASKSGDLNAIKAILATGTNVNCEDIDLGTPLCQAIVNKQNEAVKLLVLEKGADIDQPVFNQHMNPLLTAIAWDNAEAFDLLIKQGADVNYQNKVGETPLMFAIKHKQPKFAAKLLEHPEIDIELQNSDHYTALMNSVVDENIEILKLILMHPHCTVESVAFQNEQNVSALTLTRNIKNGEIKELIQDASLPYFQSVVGKILKANKLRQHCERFYDLNIRTFEDAVRNLDDKFLSWKLRVEKKQERDKILKLFGNISAGQNVKANVNYVQQSVKQNDAAVQDVLKRKVAPDVKVTHNSKVPERGFDFNSLPIAPNAPPVIVAESISDGERFSSEELEEAIPVAKVVSD